MPDRVIERERVDWIDVNAVEHPPSTKQALRWRVVDVAAGCEWRSSISGPKVCSMSRSFGSVNLFLGDPATRLRVDRLRGRRV